MEGLSMKKKIVSAIAGILLASSAFGQEGDPYAFNVESLVGIEGGYTSFDVEKNQANTPAEITKYHKGEAGIKIGAQTEHYRLFLSARNYFVDSGYDYFVTYGGELQYLFNFSKAANFFIGINGGILDSRFKVTGESESRTLSDPYYGGDLGFNIHAGKYMDIELGGRIMASEAENSKKDQNGVLTTYKFDNLVTGYVSFIFRYQMDD